MFIAAIAGGGARAYAICDDHSDHSRHHQYSDAQILADIKAREAKLAQEKAELRAIKTRLAEKYSETLNILGEEEELTEGVKSLRERSNDIPKDFLHSQLMLERELEKKLEEELMEDRNKLAEINTVLQEINRIQLTYKK